MAYIPPWERLSDALKRVMAAAELSTEAAQRDICRAIADGAVKIRAKPDKHQTNGFRDSNTVLDGTSLNIPIELKSEQLDWNQSRPFDPWLIKRGEISPPGFWYLKWIELVRADVTNVLCVPAKPNESTQYESRKGSATGRSRPERERAERALKALYPDGPRSQLEVPNKRLFQHVNEWLKGQGLPDVRNTTILRAAGRRK